MGKQQSCVCGHDKFRIYKNVYVRSVLVGYGKRGNYEHIEIVCCKCGRGVAVQTEHFFDNAVHFVDFTPPILDDPRVTKNSSGA